jgi:hypothetical protein
MSAIHGLDVLLRIPVMFNEDDSVSTSQVETKTTNTSSEQESIVGWVRVELVDNVLALLRLHCTIESHELYAGKQLLEHSRLDHVKHLLHLAEDKSTMLRYCLRQITIRSRRLVAGNICCANTAVDQEILERAELGSVNNVVDRSVVLFQILLCRLISLVRRPFDHKRR